MDVLFLILGIIIGFLFWKIFAGKKEGDKLERSFRFLIGNYWIHIHHWISCLALLILCLFLNIYNSFFYGILLGSILQGLTYRDWHVIIYHKKRFHAIYSKFNQNH
jgi:uncharacterized membrane protein